MSEDKRNELYRAYMEIIRDCRLMNNRSQAKVAKAAGLSEKYVNMLELGHRSPTLESLLALCSASGVSKATATQLVIEVLNSYEWEEHETTGQSDSRSRHSSGPPPCRGSLRSSTSTGTTKTGR